MAPAWVPRLREVVRQGKPALIVALGSSSTEGWRASNAAHTYPAVLQNALSRALPAEHFAVVNRGIGGQDAREEVARLDADVLALRGQLVIWQVGANGALRNSDPAVFRRLVTTGVQRLHAAGDDVILMDNQRAPRILAAPEHAILDKTLAEVAAATGSTLFSRGALMDSWKRQGFPYDTFISADGLHHNDFGYRCVAAALAASIVAGLGPDLPDGGPTARIAGDAVAPHVARGG